MSYFCNLWCQLTSCSDDHFVRHPFKNSVKWVKYSSLTSFCSSQTIKGNCDSHVIAFSSLVTSWIRYSSSLRIKSWIIMSPIANILLRTLMLAIVGCSLILPLVSAGKKSEEDVIVISNGGGGGSCWSILTNACIFLLLSVPRPNKTWQLFEIQYVDSMAKGDEEDVSRWTRVFDSLILWDQNRWLLLLCYTLDTWNHFPSKLVDPRHRFLICWRTNDPRGMNLAANG